MRDDRLILPASSEAAPRAHGVVPEEGSSWNRGVPRRPADLPSSRAAEVASRRGGGFSGGGGSSGGGGASGSWW